MQSADLADFVASAIASICEIDKSEIAYNTNLLDLQMDSLSLVALVSQLEAAYEVQFSADDVMELLEPARFADLLTAAEALIRRYSGN